MAKYVVSLSSRAFELFESSEVDEKRALIKLLLSNLRLDDEKLLYNVQKPFDMILKSSEDLVWLEAWVITSTNRKSFDNV